MKKKIFTSGHLVVVCLQLLLIPVAKFSSDEPHLTKHPGHLEPLGARSAKRSLETISDFPTPEKFFETYVAPVKPVLIRGGAKLSPAFTKWNDEYFSSFTESSDFQIVAEQRKKEVRTNPPIDMSFKEFVATYENKDIYMVHGVPPFLQWVAFVLFRFIFEEIVLPHWHSSIVVQCLIRLLSLHVRSCDSCFCKSSFSFVFAHRTKESKYTVPSVIIINELPLILNMAGYIGSCVRIVQWISLVVVEWGGGRRWAVLGNGEGVKERVQRTDGSSEDQGVVLWASPLQVVVKNCKFQWCWHWMSLNQPVPTQWHWWHHCAMQCHNCYHIKLLFSMLHSYRVMILEWLLLVPGLGYGVWWPWNVLSKQQVPISVSSTRSK